MAFLVDLGLAVLLSALGALGLVGFWFVEGLKQWAAKGQSVPDPTGRQVLVLSTGSACTAAIAYGLSWADLPIACTVQAVMTALLALLLLLVAGSACGKRIRRERLRWHESQHEGSTSASARRRKRRQ